MWQLPSATLCRYCTTNVGGQLSGYVNMINECTISGIWQMSVKVMTLYQHSTVTHQLPPSPFQHTICLHTDILHSPSQPLQWHHSSIGQAEEHNINDLKSVTQRSPCTHTLHMPKRKLLSQGSEPVVNNPMALFCQNVWNLAQIRTAPILLNYNKKRIYGTCISTH